MKNCINCGRKLNNSSKYHKTKRCNSCAMKDRIKRKIYNNRGINSNFYIDGRTLKKYYCKDCKKEINLNTFLYGNKRCRSCSRLIFLKLNPKFGTEKYNSRYIDGRTNKKRYCCDCNKLLTGHNPKGKRCKKCANTGKNHPNYKNGKGRFPYSIKFTPRLKEEIRQRDKNKCQRCGMTKSEHFEKYKANLEVHHRDHNRNNCNKSNLETLCKKCNIRDNRS